MISLIVAMDKNHVIGQGNKLPWHIKEELTFFKAQTMGKFLLMGRATYLGLPKPLAGRRIIVLSRTARSLGYKTVRDFAYVTKNFANSEQEIFIAGGKSIYEQFYHYASTIYVSVIKKAHKGDVFLRLDLSQYKKMVYKVFDDFIVYKYER